MKKIFAFVLIISMTFSLIACGSTSNAPDTSPRASSSEAKSDAPSVNPPKSTESVIATESSCKETGVLVAYFFATGTTKKVAEYVAQAMHADIYEIVPEIPYTSADLNYNSNDCRANTEMSDPSCRPKIDGNVKNMAGYDIVFIGYPIWWGEAPRIVSTFAESYDFSGKTVVTFCTSGGSGHNDSSIKSLVTGANRITGTRLRSNSSKSDVSAWINSLGLNIKAK